MARWTIDVGETITTTIHFDEPTNACWFGTSAGELRTVRMLGQSGQTIGSGWQDAVSVLPSVDGLTVIVIVLSGDLFVVARDRGDRADHAPVLSIGSEAVAAARLGNGDVLVLDAEGSLHRISTHSPAVTVLVENLAGATHLAVDEANGELVVAVSAATSELRRFDIADGAPLGPPTTVARVVAAIAAAPGSPGLLIADDDGNISAHRWSGSTDGFTATMLAATALCRWHSLVIAAVDRRLELVEWGADVEMLPLAAGLDPLFIGGWVPLTVEYGALGLRPDEVEWQVRDGPHAGSISVARPSDQSPDSYEHRVMSGAEASEFQIEAYERTSGTLLATRRFRVVRHWPDTEVGPPMAITGAQQVYAKPGWGGGPAGPQNINIHPAPDEIRMAVAVFRTKGAASVVDASQRVAQLKKDVVDPGQSAKTYYEEVSYRATPPSANPAHPKGTTVTLLGNEVFGPIDLNYSWADLFEPGNRSDPWGSWYPKGDTWDVLGGTFSSFIIDRGLADSVTRLADSIILAILPGTDDPYTVGDDTWSAQWSWAYAGDAQHYWKSEFSTTFKRIPAIVMPAAFPQNHPSPWSPKEWVSTICHELGHNLGCPDLYNYGAFPAEVAEREVDTWDLMNSDSPLPHFSLAHRMRLGWVSPDWIEVCDFGQNPASRTVTLQAIESVTRSGPPAGRRAGVEVRIRDGWNYYFEFRRTQAGQIGDLQLPVAAAILGTDVFQAGADDVARALILKLPLDVDGDGPVLRTTGDDYEESDVTNPDRMNDFRFTRQSTPIFDLNAVTVQIDYVGAHRPELQITPAPGRGNFKSPDIDLDGPAGPNVVVKGKTNTVRITVHNRGTKAADNVKIRVHWLPFTTAPGPWSSLAEPPTQHIPAHSSRVFTVNWPLDASVTADGKEAEHFCVRVDIDRYVDPTDPAGSEIVVHNNWAQSNFNTSAVGHGSPSERRITAVSATNVLPMRALHRTLVEQSSEHFRAFVDHAWRWLDPGATDVTQLSYESLAGDPLHDGDFQIAFRESQGERTANDLVARTFVMPDRLSDGPIERWGVQLRVRAGFRTFIERLRARGELVEGEVWAGDVATPFPASGGTVRVIGWPERRPDEQEASDGHVEADGSFRVGLSGHLVGIAGNERVRLAVFYHGTAQYTPCQSAEVELES